MTGYCIVANGPAHIGLLWLPSKSKAERRRGRRKVTDKVVVLVTCANASEAKRIARAAVQTRLAACVNVLATPVVSIYQWKGKMEQAREVLLLMKTSRKKLTALRAAVSRLHSYEVPEFIAIPIAAGSPAYMRWIDDCLQPAARGRKPR